MPVYAFQPKFVWPAFFLYIREPDRMCQPCFVELNIQDVLVCEILLSKWNNIPYTPLLRWIIRGQPSEKPLEPPSFYLQALNVAGKTGSPLRFQQAPGVIVQYPRWSRTTGESPLMGGGGSVALTSRDGGTSSPAAKRRLSMNNSSPAPKPTNLNWAEEVSWAMSLSPTWRPTNCSNPTRRFRFVAIER